MSLIIFNLKGWKTSLDTVVTNITNLTCDGKANIISSKFYEDSNNQNWLENLIFGKKEKKFHYNANIISDDIEGVRKALNSKLYIEKFEVYNNASLCMKHDEYHDTYIADVEYVKEFFQGILQDKEISGNIIINEREKSKNNKYNVSVYARGKVEKVLALKDEVNIHFEEFYSSNTKISYYN